MVDMEMVVDGSGCSRCGEDIVDGNCPLRLRCQVSNSPDVY